MYGMPGRWKQVALILLLLSLLASPLADIGLAAPPARHSLNDSLLLLTSSELWLTGDLEPVVATAGRAPGPMLGAALQASSARQTEVAINAVKYIIAVKQDWHQVYLEELEAQGRTNLVAKLDEQNAGEMLVLNAKLEDLRREWRRQKRFIPKLIKPFKQAGGWFWHQIGPAGRSILRAVGDDILQMAIAGDPISGRVVRALLVKHARTLGKEKLRQLIDRLALGERPDTGEEATEEAANGDQQTLEFDSFDPFWQAVYQQLVDDNKHCNSPGVEDYQTCLQETVDAGGSWQEALDACQIFPDSFGSNGLEETVTLGKDDYYWSDADNQVRITYTAGSNQIDGRLEVYLRTKGLFPTVVYQFSKLSAAPWIAPPAPFPEPPSRLSRSLNWTPMAVSSTRSRPAARPSRGTAH